MSILEIPQEGGEVESVLCDYTFTGWEYGFTRPRLIWLRPDWCVHLHTTYLCDDNVAVCSILIGYHVVEDELWHLRGLATPCVALDDNHLMLLYSCHYLSSQSGDGESLTLIETLER